jgi:OHCU decarboxylase
MEPLTFHRLNTLDCQSFVGAVGWVVEHSDWVAERAWRRRPFRNVEELHAAMTAELFEADAAAQASVLRAHPDLGSRVQMSSASTGEQSRAGLDRVDAADLTTLRDLNEAYQSKFGFPFLLAVKGATIRDILDALHRRLGSSREDEFGEALRQVSKIARLRLSEMFDEETS